MRLKSPVNTFLRADIVACTTDGYRYPRVAKSRFAEDFPSLENL